MVLSAAFSRQRELRLDHYFSFILSLKLLFSIIRHTVVEAGHLMKASQELGTLPLLFL